MSDSAQRMAAAEGGSVRQLANCGANCGAWDDLPKRPERPRRLLTFGLLPDERLRSAVEARWPDRTARELAVLYEGVR